MVEVGVHVEDLFHSVWCTHGRLNALMVALQRLGLYIWQISVEFKKEQALIGQLLDRLFNTPVVLRLSLLQQQHVVVGCSVSLVLVQLYERQGVRVVWRILAGSRFLGYCDAVGI